MDPALSSLSPAEQKKRRYNRYAQRFFDRMTTIGLAVGAGLESLAHMSATAVSLPFGLTLTAFGGVLYMLPLVCLCHLTAAFFQNRSHDISVVIINQMTLLSPTEKSDFIAKKRRGGPISLGCMVLSVFLSLALWVFMPVFLFVFPPLLIASSYAARAYSQYQDYRIDVVLLKKISQDKASRTHEVFCQKTYMLMHKKRVQESIFSGAAILLSSIGAGAAIVALMAGFSLLFIPVALLVVSLTFSMVSFILGRQASHLSDKVEAEKSFVVQAPPNVASTLNLQETPTVSPHVEFGQTKGQTSREDPLVDPHLLSGVKQE
jgi:hypothetical protein